MRKSGGGRGWLLLLAIPPAVVVGGLVALFVWQGSKGGVRGKWQKAPASEATAAREPDRTNGIQGKR